METVTKKGRVLLYDELRGIMIISMLDLPYLLRFGGGSRSAGNGLVLLLPAARYSGSFRSAVSLSSSPERAAAIPKAI